MTEQSQIEEITQSEVTMEVFRLIRANDQMKPERLWKLIKEYLPDVSKQMITEALLYIYQRSV